MRRLWTRQGWFCWTVLFMLSCSWSIVRAATQQDAWFQHQQPTPLAWQAVTVLQQADQDGLRPSDYHAAQLQQALQTIAQSGGRAEAAFVAQTAQQLQAAMQRFLQDLATGRVSPHSVHQGFDAVARQFDAAAALKAAIESKDLAGAVSEATPSFPLYAILKKWLAHYRAMDGSAAWAHALVTPKNNKLELGQTYPQLPLLRARLELLGDYRPSLSNSHPAAVDVYDPVLVEAVKTFQRRHGLTDDGIIGTQTLQALNVTPAARAHQIEMSMERIRWTPLQRGQRILVVNIPGYMLYGYEIKPDGQIDLQVEMRVVIGKALNHRTPLMDETMQYIEFSPYWNVPPSIARAETVPALRRDKGYLARQQLEFVDRDGKVSTEVTEAALEAVLKGQMRIRQRPGPHNALGGVKFAFPNNQNIFMHHTPATQLFSRSRRDFSHGCIRVEDPVALARFVLQSNPGWDDARIEQAMHLGQSNFTRLKEPVPVVLGYSTVMARNGEIFFYPDVYGYDRTLEKALMK